jgi:hypothetical protein
MGGRSLEKIGRPNDPCCPAGEHLNAFHVVQEFEIPLCAHFGSQLPSRQTIKESFHWGLAKVLAFVPTDFCRL